MLGTAAVAQGATIVWNADIDNGLTLADNVTMLPVNSLVRLGYFDIDAATIQANATNLAFLDSKFHQLDFDRIGGSEVGGDAGYFRESYNFTDLSAAGKQLVVWALASADNSSVASSVATATQIGIFYMTGGTAAGQNPNWVVPTDAELGFATIDLSDLTGSGPTAGLLSGANVLAGSFTENTAGKYNAKNFALQVVPEPGTTGLAVIGGIAMLLRRRRRA